MLGIRACEPGDMPALHALGRRADGLFAAHGYPQIAEAPETPFAEFRAFLESDPCLVATWSDPDRPCDGGGRAIGFAVAGPFAGVFYLRELSVDPDFGRRGVGSSLLEAVAGLARAKGFDALALSTFRDVPFNAPFYARRGFAELDPAAAPAALGERFFSEVPAGVDPARRILMLRRL
ncbi:MAG: GNAT family N-acetyltransferase [Mesorhizobium sp.]|nr:GNAT family N-acetyltransferase [Mesorhizobium sp.]